MSGTFLIAYFNQPQQQTVRISFLYLFLASGFTVYITALFTFKGSSLLGPCIGGLSGFLGAYSQLFQKLVSSSLDFSGNVTVVLTKLIQNPENLVWIALSALSMIVIQFAYKYAEATRIIPVFTANFILVPVIGGVLVFGEKLNPIQILGILFICTGSYFLGKRREKY